MGGIARRLQRLEQGGAGAVSEARQWQAVVEAAEAAREGRAYTIPAAVAEALSRSARPGGWRDTVEKAHQRRTGQEPV